MIPFTNTPTNSDAVIEAVLCVGLPYMNDEWAKYPKDQWHMIEAFKNTQGYREAKAAIQKLLADAQLEARLDELEHVTKMGPINGGVVTNINMRYVTDRINELKANQQTREKEG